MAIKNLTTLRKSGTPTYVTPPVVEAPAQDDALAAAMKALKAAEEAIEEASDAIEAKQAE